MAEPKKQDDLIPLLTKLLEDIKNNTEKYNLPQEYAPFEQVKEVIKNERKKQKVTRDTLSKLSGVSIGTLNAIEQGKLTVSVGNLQKVLNTLGKKLWIK